jgi:hypothetical protein
MQITDLLARWQTDEGKPYKGSLIDFDAYEAAPDNIGCMCAQGQALHLLAGWTPDRLRDVKQAEADAATARLLNISRAHAILLRQVNDTTDGAPAIVLTDPGKVLGDQWSKLLDFWWRLDGMTAKQWAAARAAAWDAAWDAARAAAWDAAWAAARDAARAAAGDAARVAAWDAAGDAARAAAWDAARASSEIQGASVLRRDSKPFFFLPAFGFASPDDIPARPADYGVAA